MPSDFHYVISGLTGKPKSARFFAFSVVKSKLMIRFKNVKRPQTRGIISQNSKQICDVISGFYFELKSAIFLQFSAANVKTSVDFAKQKRSCTPHSIADSEFINRLIIGAELTEE